MVAQPIVRYLLQEPVEIFWCVWTCMTRLLFRKGKTLIRGCWEIACCWGCLPLFKGSSLVLRTYVGWVIAILMTVPEYLMPSSGFYGYQCTWHTHIYTQHTCTHTWYKLLFKREWWTWEMAHLVKYLYKGVDLNVIPRAYTNPRTPCVLWGDSAGETGGGSWVLTGQLIWWAPGSL